MWHGIVIKQVCEMACNSFVRMIFFNKTLHLSPFWTNVFNHWRRHILPHLLLWSFLQLPFVAYSSWRSWSSLMVSSLLWSSNNSSTFCSLTSKSSDFSKEILGTFFGIRLYDSFITEVPLYLNFHICFRLNAVLNQVCISHWNLFL